MHARRGFTLIEVVITIFLIGLLAILTASILKVTPLSSHAKEQHTALAIASNKIEELRADGYAALPASGSFSDTDLANLPDGSGAIAVSVYNAKTKQVTVTVSWNENGTSQNVALTTLVTEIGGLP
jgi:prepilin-type N-terminal cleavage/methylation domain-containing protein